MSCNRSLSILSSVKVKPDGLEYPVQIPIMRQLRSRRLPVDRFKNATQEYAETKKLVNVCVFGITRRRQACIAVVDIYHEWMTIRYARPIERWCLRDNVIH